ncbi:uncharacterized protein PGTG_12669 [Puccinia graminis f. sp. tritici CRL 75-36-700-3]|uniref:Uncharacterized protein n=1 Tax=Puccinia graminis f. sp. tritici (strain CRL 75-36-700-3 / race SCCL) TaxID=418459 RepID=E3KRK3_PUCGT|nr:uncharacterized protein PGTG_12669 [Puccinia graminis f. sp. tritici CRL 75-36-700-3]EFP86928.1 hypothetical protein PGTG_12669 [Puccinia graminis f. sp. tritici CRL 75-36-700-3]
MNLALCHLSSTDVAMRSFTKRGPEPGGSSGGLVGWWLYHHKLACRLHHEVVRRWVTYIPSAPPRQSTPSSSRPSQPRKLWGPHRLGWTPKTAITTTPDRWADKPNACKGYPVRFILLFRSAGHTR